MGRGVKRCLGSLAVVIVAVATLAACAEAEPEVPAGDDGVVVPHAFGETSLDGSAERIVALTPPFIDALIALDVTPTAAGVYPTGGGELLPWQAEIADSTEIVELNADYSIPMEAIAAFEPDLILAGPLVTDESVYERLTSVAPTIPALSSDGFVDPWQDQTLLVGQATGKVEEAQAAIDEAEATLAEAAETYSQLAGRDYAFLAYADLQTIGVLNNPEDTAAAFFDSLGLTLSEASQAVPTQGVQGEISPEVLTSLDADVLFVTYFNEDDRETVEAQSLFQSLSAVQEGRYFATTLNQANAIRSPTILNGPWLAEELGSFLSGLEF